MDQRLIDAATRGDRPARAELLRSMQDRWFRFAVSVLDDSEAAQDAVQESAVRVLEKLHRFDGRSTFSTWSIGIVLNVCREMRRRRRSLRLDDSPEPAFETEHSLDHDEGIARLQAALGDLPERQREAIVLRFFEAQSVEQTAQSMQCAEGTVKATVYQALAALKVKLASLR